MEASLEVTGRGRACRASLTEEISRVLPVARQLQSVAAANGWASGRPAMSAQADASLATPASTSVEAARPAPSRRRSMGSPPPLSQPSGTPPSEFSPSGVVPRRATFATLPLRTLDAAAVATDAGTAAAAAANAIARIGAGDALLSGRRNRSAAAGTATAATDASGSHDPAAITTNIKVRGLYTLGWRSLSGAPSPAPNALASQRAGVHNAPLSYLSPAYTCIAPQVVIRLGR